MNKTYIGYSSDKDIRYKASSGGVGTSIIKYLFDSGTITGCLSFIYSQDNLCYKPQIVTRFDDYTISSSIYQEIDTVKFIRQWLIENESKVNGGIALFCLPCQAKQYKLLFKKYNINLILIGLVCSSQQSIEATEYLYKRLNIKKEDVLFIQYRGNGWPSGIQIKLKNGKEVFINNNDSVWTDIFHSRLFIPKRCFCCNNTLNKYCDIVLADPWLPEFMLNEKIGKTLFSSYTKEGQLIVNKIIEDKYIICEQVDNNILELSQKKTILRKNGYKNHPKIRRVMVNLFMHPYYIKTVCSNSLFFNLHKLFRQKLEYLLYKK